MNILYVHQHFCTPAGAGGTRSYELARRWVTLGHRVEMLCGAGYDESIQPGEKTTIEGIEVDPLPVRYDNRMGFLARLIAFVRFAILAMLRAARASQADVILATSTPLTVALPALAGKWIAGRPMVFEVRDVWPDAAVDAGVLRNPLLTFLARALETITYRAADHIVPLSTGMVDRLRRKGVPASKMTVIPNGCDLASFAPDPQRRDKARHDLDAGDDCIILYVGAVSLANDMPFLAEVIKQMAETTGLQWWFVGGGNRLDELKRRLAGLDRPPVRFFGPQPKAEIPRYMAAADVGVVSFLPTPTYYENSPNKCFDYLAAGLPVVFNRTTWLAPALREFQAGWVVAENTPAAMARLLRKLATGPDRLATAGQNARRLAEARFARDDQARIYLNLLTPIAHGEPHARRP